jgi:hypothetical protein
MKYPFSHKKREGSSVCSVLDTWLSFSTRKLPRSGIPTHHLSQGETRWRHYSKNRTRYRFIDRFIVNRVVTDKILAYWLIYRDTNISADFWSDGQYFGRFSVKLRWTSICQSIFSFYGLVELCNSSKFPLLLIQMQGMKVILLFNAPILENFVLKIRLYKK